MKKQLDIFDEMIKEAKAFKDIRPIAVKRRGRPAGSKNKNTNISSKPLLVENGGSVLKHEADPIVDLMVQPVITINGIPYGGAVRVKQSMANELVYMMQQYRKGIENVTKDGYHKTIDLGEV